MTVKAKVGDTVDLGVYGPGQIWSPALGPGTWHVIAADQSGHIWHERTGSHPAGSTEFLLAEHRARVDRKYGSYGSLGYGHRLHLTNTEARTFKRRKPAVLKHAA